MMYFFSNSEVYLKYTSFHKKSRSINEVLLKYKQSTFLFFSVFILHLYFFLGSSLKVYFYWSSSILKVYVLYGFFCKYIDIDPMVVGTYYIDIFPADPEKVIRKKLVDLFKKKLPLISENVFEFVKCNSATISDTEVIGTTHI